MISPIEEEAHTAPISRTSGTKFNWTVLKITPFLIRKAILRKNRSKSYAIGGEAFVPISDEIFAIFLLVLVKLITIL